MITTSELIKISAKTHAEINVLCCGQTWAKVFAWSCNIKKALAEYSKKREFDNVQMDIMGHIAWLERYLWNAYYTHTLPDFLRVNPSFALKDKQYAKQELLKNFANIMKSGYN